MGQNCVLAQSKVSWVLPRKGHHKARDTDIENLRKAKATLKGADLSAAASASLLAANKGKTVVFAAAALGTAAAAAEVRPSHPRLRG